MLGTGDPKVWSGCELAAETALGKKTNELGEITSSLAGVHGCLTIPSLGRCGPNRALSENLGLSISMFGICLIRVGPLDG